jgi:mercuric ion transport protein
MPLDSVPKYGSKFKAMNTAPEDRSTVSTRSGRGALAAGGLAALLASACCLGPLVLLSLGIGGAWIANLTALQPYRPLFIGLALLALFFAGRRIFRRAADCKPGEVCGVPRVKTTYKLMFWLIAALVAVGLVFPWIAPWFY